MAPTVPTPWQTVGPFFGFALPAKGYERLVADDDPQAVRIVGRVLDGSGDPVPDALVEVWQANRVGRYAHPADDREHLPLEDRFTGFGRSATDAEGRFRFVTVKPGPVPWPDGRPQAPHLEVAIFARGLLKWLVTRVYFPDEEEANAADPLLASLEDAELRSTLVARAEANVLRFDVHLQGARQTAFFAC